MAFAKRMKARISGTYRHGERKLAPIVARHICRGMSEGIFKEQSTVDYFKNWIPYFEKMPLFAKTARIFGKHLAYKILRLKKKDIIQVMIYAANG